MTLRQTLFTAFMTALIMSLVISAILVFLNVGAAGFMKLWPITWLRAFISAFACSLFVPKLVRKLMIRLHI